MLMRCRGAITASTRPSAHVATFRRLPAATCPPRPGLSRSSDAHHQNASRATCAATTELGSVGRCFLARRGNTVARGQASVVAMRPRAPHCLVLSTPTTEASSVVGRTRAVDAEASSCHESVEQHTTTGLPRCTTRQFMDSCPGTRSVFRRIPSFGCESAAPPGCVSAGNVARRRVLNPDYQTALPSFHLLDLARLICASAAG